MMLMALLLLVPIEVTTADKAPGIQEIIYNKAIEEGLSNEVAKVLVGICWVESSHRPKARKIMDGGSPSYGLCQIKLNTARWLGYTGEARGLYNASTNATYAARYLKYQLNRYNGNIGKAVSAYNAGRYSTKNTKYVKKVERATRNYL